MTVTKKQIGLYCRELGGWGKGTAKHIQEIVNAIAKHPAHDLDFHLIAPELALRKAEWDGIQFHPLPAGHRLIQDHLYAAKVLNKIPLDLVWCPKNVIPYGLKHKALVTFLDLAYFLPQYRAYGFFDNIYMKFMFRRSASKAAKLTALSENTRQDAIKLLKVPPQKISVFYPIVSAKYRPITDASKLKAVKERYHLPDRFIFFAGDLSPRKNISRLLQALKIILDKTPLSIVVTGTLLRNSGETCRLLDLLGRNALRLGKIQEQDLPVIYSLSEIYAHVSLYEGFGLPIIEAQACGVPVLSSNVSCMPEVAGDGALYVNPYDINAIADGLLRLATDYELRQALIKKGLKNASRFTSETGIESFYQAAREAIEKQVHSQ